MACLQDSVKKWQNRQKYLKKVLNLEENYTI